MKPPTLLALLVFLVLWGADDALRAAWLPSARRPASAHQEVVPLSLYLREQVYRQMRPALLRPAPAVSARACPSPKERRSESADVVGAPLAVESLYALKSLQL